MGTLLNSLFFVFTISFLPKHRVKYYDYSVYCKVVQWDIIGELNENLPESGSLKFD